MNQLPLSSSRGAAPILHGLISITDRNMWRSDEL